MITLGKFTLFLVKYSIHFSYVIQVEWTFGPVKEYELLDPASSLQDIHILHRGGAQIPTGHFV
jgi:hypothetical protein